MAKNTLTIEEKMTRLSVYKDVIEHIEGQIKYHERDAKDYLEKASEDLDEDGEINKTTYAYRQYEEAIRLAEAYKQLQEDLLAEA